MRSTAKLYMQGRRRTVSVTNYAKTTIGTNVDERGKGNIRSVGSDKNKKIGTVQTCLKKGVEPKGVKQSGEGVLKV